MNGRELATGIPLEHFIQALTSQLDRAQTALALKARAGLPLTFAVKDLTLDLRAHVEFGGAVVRIRPAGPGEAEASTLHFALTTITRPMMEENTLRLTDDRDDPSLNEAAGEELSEEDLRRLEWAGVQTVSQLVRLREEAGDQAIERIASVPAMRLRAALERASRPLVHDVLVERPPEAPADAPPLLRVRGRNLLRDVPPAVRMGNQNLRVLRATPNELVVSPLAHQLGGVLEIETAPGVRVSHEMATDEGGAS